MTTPSPDSAQVRPTTPPPAHPAADPHGHPAAPPHGHPAADTHGYPAAPPHGYPVAPPHGHGYQAGPPPGYPAAPPRGYPGPWPQGQPPRPVSPGGQPLASFGDRLLAYLIDTAIFLFASLLVMVPVVLVFVYAVIIPSVDAGAGEPPPVSVLLWVVGMQAVIMALSLAMGYVYYVEIMLRRNGQTVGKKVMKLRTIPIDPAAVLTRPMAGRRYLAQFVGGTFIPAFSYIDGLWQLWDKPYQQCLHDKFASTVVVKVVAQ